MPVTYVANDRLLEEIERRQVRAMLAVGQFYLGQMARTLANSPTRTGRKYRFEGGRLYPIPDDAFSSFESAAGYKRDLGRGRNAAVRVHIASAPGEPPALLRGDLRRRRTSRLDAQGRELVMRFGSNVPYSRRLELGGTARGWRGRMVTIEPRPAWVPTWAAALPTLRQIYVQEFRAAA